MNKRYIVAVLAALGTLLLAGAGCSSGSSPDSNATSASVAPADQSAQATTATNNVVTAPAQSSDQVQTPPPSPSPVSVPSSSQVKEFTVTAKNWEFDPGTITVHKGDKVRLKITSVDIEHGFALPDFNINADLQPGQTQIIEFTADKVGTFTFFCSVFCGEGHRQMVGQFIVQ